MADRSRPTSGASEDDQVEQEDAIEEAEAEVPEAGEDEPEAAESPAPASRGSSRPTSAKAPQSRSPKLDEAPSKRGSAKAVLEAETARPASAGRGSPSASTRTPPTTAQVLPTGVTRPTSGRAAVAERLARQPPQDPERTGAARPVAADTRQPVAEEVAQHSLGRRVDADNGLNELDMSRLRDLSGDVDAQQDEANASEDEDEASELVVLDPNHPLMRRFQTALKAQLEKQHEKVALELREQSEALKRRREERESLGVQLYGAQQELARQQVALEQNHDNHGLVKQQRLQTEQLLEAVRNTYRQMQHDATEDRKKAKELRAEVENLALRLFYVENAKEDVRSDIAVMRRAAEKADVDVAKAELKKQMQDLYVDRLVERVDKLREEIALTDAQITMQQQETKAAREALTEATMEMESIVMEKRQLFAQWNSSLIGMKRRDEAHAAMQEALEQQKQKIKALETEIDGYKRQIAHEQEQHEKLTLILNKCQVDVATSKKLLSICQSKMDALKSEYAAYSRMLHETEVALGRATMEKNQRENEVDALRKQIEKEFLKKVQLEDEIMERMRNQLTYDKAAQYTEKMTKRTRTLTKDLESQVTTVENEIARDALETANAKARSDLLKEALAELDGVINSKNEIITKSENEILKRNAVIERKQQVIDQYNKKLEQMIAQAGGVELGPLEIQTNSLAKSIESVQQDIASLQLMWLREQGELVRQTRERDEQNAVVSVLHKKITILSQKKIRIENSIAHEQEESEEVATDIEHLRNDMIKLNKLLHKERGLQESLEKGSVLIENDFVGKLKEAEHNSIELQAKLDGLREEKDRLLNSLVEAERQIMLWEKKTQLARETRAAVDSEVGQGEIKTMKAEIHRMEVRYAQLMKEQEKMIQDMEKSVSRRDSIITRGDAQAKIAQRNKSKDQVVTKGTFERQMADLRKKIKQSIQEAQVCDGEIQELRSTQARLSETLEQRQSDLKQLQTSADSIETDLERLAETKQRNVSDLAARQQRSKYLQQVKEAKYKRLVRGGADSLASEKERQVDQMQALSNIVERLQQEFPHTQTTLHRISASLGSRIAQEGQS